MRIFQSGCILLLSALAASASAQNKQKVDIERVTVFLRGAELENHAKVALPQGESEIIFTNVAGNMLEQSVSVGVDNGVTVLSATPKNDYLANEQLSPRFLALKDSIERLSEDVQQLQDRKTVLNQQLDVLRQNVKVSGENTGLSVAELQKLLDLINIKMNGLLTESHALDKQVGKINELIALMRKQQDEEKKRAYQPGGQLLVKFYTEKPVTANVGISYVVSDAGWTPGYDIRVDNINSPVKLIYKANVYQNTGVKWDDVKLTLSTGNPNEGAESPVLNPTYLSFRLPPTPKPSSQPSRNTADMAALSTGVYEGDMKVTQWKRPLVDVAKPGVDFHLDVDNSGTNTKFDIDIAYTIPSDGTNHLVSLKEYELPATYRYYVVPKMDNDVFLQAQVTKWEDLNLLPAPTSIFYEGTYIGQGNIDMRNVHDTLNLSLGRDKKIIVKRDNDKNYRKVKALGSSLSRSMGYTINIRNTRKEAINLVVLEQFPISNDKDIEVNDKEAPLASIDEATGEVKWELKMKPSEMQTLKLNYSVKYPKDKQVNGL